MKIMRIRTLDHIIGPIYLILSSLRLYADYITMYTADTSAAVLQFVTNDDSSLSNWFNVNYLAIYPDKTQALVLGHSNYQFPLRIDNASTSVSEHLKI